MKTQTTYQVIHIKKKKKKLNRTRQNNCKRNAYRLVAKLGMNNYFYKIRHTKKRGVLRLLAS